MIIVKTPEEIKIMAEGGKILANIMKELEKNVGPGITTKELDELAEELILKSGGKCSFKNYQGFPACLCTSINEEIVHVIPSDRKLKEGDIISLDIGMKYKGFHTDMAITIPVGKVCPEVQRLIRVTKKALKRGIKKARIGNTFGDISNTIQRYVEGQGYNVVRELCGHGIGKEIHEEPQILNFGKRRAGSEIKEGMTFCIEPMITVGDWKLKKAKDGHGFETDDGSLSCHFEHTIAATKDGAKILTMIK
ncbi:MAG: type I methionyl aminopeptidase [Parcubacteria group bacterium CG1_02_39_15]|uniref:Methionine aminopeptidase n=3 Tax=Candidatus Nealsoniibacteriota TaxID=1817911 RepID=A0A2G9YSI5_9BACT|nr:MAG: type I methionyl aminopeptidase [Parcubacteria group bacterium CG1_02_39_15]PIP22205.1 MAG: type I methionyl aminopeptidase [Candidatus Nealsonbacteria bacterium CG23_combo_of_CG06-09_8_20_14_all_39_25]PIQ98284.1 MAG: type I methionyl aminopeptidase [Candidatus Nealsonbacteria bacterium CG11_big_fil_rev_8_21_14_0_20_39_9]PIW90051.1 MAG: type I methionyl aminopeptidase [Candidatus Nealsonbacteria bacterium CG_4_8_14_3_um_filter_40_11]